MTTNKPFLRWVSWVRASVFLRHIHFSNELVFLLLISQIPWIIFHLRFSQTSQNNPNVMECKSYEPGSENDLTATECLDLRMNARMPPQDDPLLAKYVREKFLLPPNYSTLYNLAQVVNEDTDTSQTGQWAVIKELFNKTTNGFFVDCGAHDGEYMSNTIWLEKNRGWNGLLIEVEPKTFKILKSKNRKAWLANVCLSPTVYPGMQTFYFTKIADSSGSGLNEITFNGAKVKAEAYCLPLYSLLLALNRTTVDVFSLDIEGAELDILKTIPFDKVLIKMLVIEHAWIPKQNNRNGAQQLREFMNGKNYKFYRNLRNHDGAYVHSSLLPSNFVEDAYGL